MKYIKLQIQEAQRMPAIKKKKSQKRKPWTHHTQTVGKPKKQRKS